MSFTKILRELKKTYLFLRLKEIEHRLTYEKSYKRMVQAMERFKKCDDKKPRSQINKEMKLCKKFWGCYPLHYYRYNLYRRDKDLSEKELLNYIPEFFFYELFLPFYDSKKYKILLEDKIITEQFFRSLAIPQAHTICKLINNQIYTSELEGKDFNTIEQELADRKYQKIFVKPAEGRGGHGIYIFNRNDKGHYLTRDSDIFNEKFLKKIGTKFDYIVQPGVSHDSEISKIYPHSVNTFRINTENKNGAVRILCPIFFRFGRNGNQVDNFDLGGLLLTIEVDTGKLGDYATSMQFEYFERHPDTNFPFRGHKISRWKEVKQFVVECAKKMPQFTYLGWDIALTLTGPLVIEANLGTGLDGLQIHSGGLREMFGIDDPKYYWKNMGKRI